MFDAPSPDPADAPTASRPHRWQLARRLLSIACWLLLLPALAVLALRLSGVSVGTPWVQLLALTPLFGIPAAVAALGFSIARRRPGFWVSAAVVAAFIVLTIAPFAPAPAPRTDAAASESVSLRMMSLNARLGQADPRAIVELVRAEGVQLLALQEYTPALAAGLADAGLGSLLPHVFEAPEGGAAGAAVYSIFELDRVNVPALEEMSFENPTLRFTVTDAAGREKPVSITNVHTYPPLLRAVPFWKRDLARLAGVSTERGTRILAGDFNATYDHREFRELLHATPDAPLVDVSTRGTARFTPTWPRENPLLPGVVIDHVLTSNDVKSSCLRTLRVPGSDHAAIVATLDFG